MADGREGRVWLRVSPVTVYRLVHDGTIPFQTVGRAYRIKLTDLEDHVAAHRIERGTIGQSLQGGEEGSRWSPAS